MRAIDAAAVEALRNRWRKSGFGVLKAFSELEALLATAVEAEPVCEDDGLTVYRETLHDATGEEYDIGTINNDWVVTGENENGWVDYLDKNGEFSGLDNRAKFPTLPAARAALSKALKAGAL